VRIWGRAILFCLGLVFAIPAGFMTLAVGTSIEPSARELVTELGLAGADAILADLWHGGPTAFDAAGLLVGMWALSAALLILPPAFVALVGEIAGLRSFAWYGVGTGLFTAALPWLGRDWERWSEGAMLGAEARITTLLFLTGAAAGLTYWLVAGRSAGHPAPSSSGGA
jgi:hypothetical protein